MRSARYAKGAEAWLGGETVGAGRCSGKPLGEAAENAWCLATTGLTRFAGDVSAEREAKLGEAMTRCDGGETPLMGGRDAEIVMGIDSGRMGEMGGSVSRVFPLLLVWLWFEGMR